MLLTLILALWLVVTLRAIKTRSPFVVQRDEAQNAVSVLLDTRYCAGNLFFVQSTHTNKGDTAGRGTSPDAPFNTIDYAIGQCTASQGDVIIVLPGHSETVTAAAGIEADVAGITIIGIGEGKLCPTVNFTTTAAATFKISAANVSVEGLIFTCGIASQVTM